MNNLPARKTSVLQTDRWILSRTQSGKIKKRRQIQNYTRPKRPLKFLNSFLSPYNTEFKEFEGLLVLNL